MEKHGCCVQHGAAWLLQGVHTHSDNTVPSLASLGQFNRSPHPTVPSDPPNVTLSLQGALPLLQAGLALATGGGRRRHTLGRREMPH